MELCKTLNVSSLANWNFAHVLTAAAVYISWRGLKVRMEKFAKWWRHTLELCYWNRQQLSDLKNTNGGLAIYYRTAPRLSLRKGGGGVEVSLFFKRYIHFVLCCVSFAVWRRTSWSLSSMSCKDDMRKLKNFEHVTAFRARGNTWLMETSKSFNKITTAATTTNH